MPKIATASHELFYTHNGVAAEVHLLLVHGAADTHLGWPAELRRLAGVSVYALDLPGHGRSPCRGVLLSLTMRRPWPTLWPRWG